METILLAKREWLSVHVFFDGYIYHASCDQVILDFVRPFVHHCLEQQWINQYFFVRYREQGAHIRLRLQGDRDVLSHCVKPALRDRVPLSSNILQGEEDLSVACTHPNVSHLGWIPYKPEINRYGGSEAIFLAERLFFFSSEAAISLIQDMDPEDRSARYGRALLAMLALIYVLTDAPEQAEMLAQHHNQAFRGQYQKDERDWGMLFERGYERQAEQLVDQLRHFLSALVQGRGLPEPMHSYRTFLVELKTHLLGLLEKQLLLRNETTIETWAEAVFALGPSYMHMTNNRIGISPLEEAYLAHLLGKMWNRVCQ